MKDSVLKTKRLTLRKPRMSDAGKMLYMYQERHLSRVTRIPYPYTLRDAKEFLKRKTGKDSCRFFITLNETKEIIGSMEFVEISRRDNWGNAGYLIAKKHRNKGYASEACQALLDFGFNTLKLNRISINHVEGNEASKRIILKLGAKYEGMEREGIRTGDGKYRNRLLYAILAKDWKVGRRLKE